MTTTGPPSRTVRVPVQWPDTPYGVVSSQTPTSSTLLFEIVLPVATTLPALKMQIADPRLFSMRLREIEPSDVFTYDTPMPRLR